MRIVPRRRKGGQRTPWEQIVMSEARRHAVADRVELEALEAEVFEHGAPAALTYAGAGKTSLRRFLGRLRRRH